MTPSSRIPVTDSRFSFFPRPAPLLAILSSFLRSSRFPFFFRDDRQSTIGYTRLFSERRCCGISKRLSLKFVAGLVWFPIGAQVVTFTHVISTNPPGHGFASEVARSGGFRPHGSPHHDGTRSGVEG